MYETLLPLADPVGIIGVILLLIAYFALSTGRMAANSLTYQLANFTAAWLILFSLFFHWNTPSVLIEMAWITISVIGMVRIVCARAKESV
jgi:hypothetical protein